MQSRMGSSIPDGFAIPVDVNSFRRLNYTQAILLFLDLIFTLLGENNTRSSIVPSAAVYLLQILILGGNFVVLLVRFTNTIIFKGGIVRLLYREFKSAIFAWAIYFALTLVVRLYGLLSVTKCFDATCDIYSDLFLALFTVYRIAALGYYFTFARGVIKICDSKFYKDSSWLRRELQLLR